VARTIAYTTYTGTACVEVELCKKYGEMNFVMSMTQKNLEPQSISGPTTEVTLQDQMKERHTLHKRFINRTSNCKSVTEVDP